MNDGPVPRGILNAPRLGSFRVPLDFIPLVLVLGVGILFGMPLWILVGTLFVAGASNAYFRRFGNGFLRGVLLFWTTGHLHLHGRDRLGKREARS
ncbi:MAG: hypothetical protein ACYCYP_06505 [Leptospirales bacterium]